MKLLAGIGKEQSQHLGAHNREQSVQECPFDAAVFMSNALNIQEFNGFESPNAPANRLQRGVDRDVAWDASSHIAMPSRRKSPPAPR